MRTLAVANMTEFNASTRRTTFSPSEREDWRRASDELADMAAFWGAPRKVLLAPRGTDREWLADLCDQLRLEVELVEPVPRNGGLVEDLLTDGRTLARLATLAGPVASLEPWGATREVLALAAALGALGVEVRHVAPRPEDLWSVGYLDGKLALRDLGKGIAGLRVPPSHTALDFDQLAGIVRVLARKRRPFVVKSNVGVGGFGTFMPSPAALDAGPDATVRSLEHAIAAEPVFRETPYLVEEWVPSAAGALKPTFDGIVCGPGHVDVVGVGGMLIEGTSYRGVAVGDVPLPRAVVVEAERLGREVGLAAAALGFRGWYDVDFVLSEDGALHATEINARRTSPTHAFALLDRWQTLDPAIGCVLTDDHLPVDLAERPTWRSVASVLEAVQGDGVCCVATIVRSLDAPRPAIGVAIGARTYDDARAARRELAARATRRRPRRPLHRGLPVLAR